MPVRDAGSSFVDSISALTSHPSTHTLVLYASDYSKVVVLAVHDIWSEMSFMCRLSFFYVSTNTRVYERSLL